jgi:hypothetical protein
MTGHWQKNIPTFAGMFFVLDLFYYFSLSGLMERPAFFAFGVFLKLIAYKVILPHLCH